MRLLQLDLRAFGPFTDRVLDFLGGAPDGPGPDLTAASPGLHVIYGANEAGKSSALRALKALLYGIDPRTPDKFVHDYNQLLLGGRIRRSDGTELAFLRRKGNKNTLLDIDKQPFGGGDDALLPFLGGVDADRFSLLFGIGHEDLVKGGRELLEAGGGIGESLFAAALGGTRLREVREALDQEAEKLFLKNGKNPCINKALRELTEARKQIKESSLSSDEWSAHHKALETARADREKVQKILREHQAEKARLERIRRALPALTLRSELVRRQDELGEVVALGPEFRDERRETQRALADAAADCERIAAELETLEAEIAELGTADALLAQGDGIDDLFQRLGTARKAATDRRAHEASREQLLVAARALVAELRPEMAAGQIQLDRPGGVDTLRPSTAFKARLHELGNQHRALELAVDKASCDVEESTAGIAELEAELGRLAPPPPAQTVSMMRRAVEEARTAGDLESRLSQATRELEAAERQAGVELGRLGLWQGTLDTLEALPVPTDATVSRFEADWLAEDQARARLTERMGEAEARKVEIDRELEALRLHQAVPTEADLDTSRAHRDALWHVLRGQYIAGTAPPEQSPEEVAGAFERSLREADGLADRLRREADRVAKQAGLLARRSEQERILTDMSIELRSLDEARARLTADWHERWADARIQPLHPKEMRAWLMRHGALVQQAAGLRGRRMEAEKLAERATSLCQGLQAGLAACSDMPAAATPAPAAGLLVLLDRAGRLLDQMTDTESQRRSLTSALKQTQERLSRQRRECNEAAARLDAWRVEWRQLVARLGLEGGSTPSMAYAVLGRFEELFDKLDQAKGLAARIHGIDQEARGFEADVTGLVERAAPDLHAQALPAEQAVQALHERLQQARKDQATRAELARQRQDKHALLARNRDKHERMLRRLSELCKQAQCQDPDALEAIEERAAQLRELKKQLANTEQQLIAQGEIWTLEQLIHEASQITRDGDGGGADSLPGRIAELEAEIQALDSKRSELEQTIGHERAELGRMDGASQAAEAAEQAQGKLAEIREAVERYMRIRLAAEILRREIERYREQNQGPLLSRASELFAMLTLGSFARLQVGFNEKDEAVLEGMRPSGEAVRVEAMSDGTRDQLFLALRVASLERYIGQHEPMPFVVDDILIHFDDQRAEAALRVLDILSGKTQILFFTHHHRLIELAQSTVSPETLHIHRLG